MTETLEASGTDAHLSVELSREGDAVELHYRFRNQGRSDAYVFDRLYTGYDPEAGYTLAPERAYVEATAEGFVVSRKVVPVPPLVSVERRQPPCVSKVAPGTAHEGSVRLALPLRPWTQYARPGDAELEETPVPVRVWFELGFFFPPPAGEALVREVPTRSGPALLFDPFPAGSQRLLRVGPFAATLPARRPRSEAP